MYNGKLFLWLDSLSKQEKTRFREFIFSPFFNKNEDVQNFLTLIYADENRKLTKQKAFKALFPGQPYNVRKVTDQVYYLTRLVEEFLALQPFRQSEVLPRVNLLGETLDRNIEKAVLFTSREIEHTMSERPYRDNDHFYYEYLYQNKMDKYFLGRGKVERDESLQKKSDSLDLFYLSAKLRDCCEMVNRTLIIESSYRMDMLRQIIDFLKSDSGKETLRHPAVSIYYSILLMLQDPEDEHKYHQLVRMIGDNHALFPVSELRDMYIYAQNYCIRKVNAGENKYYRELFEINKTLLDNDLIFSGKYLTERDYKNIVSIALRLGEYEWTLDFIEKFKKDIAPEFRQNAYTYNLANYHYETGNHKKAVKLLRGVEFTDLYYNLDAKSMLLKIYFEQEEEEAFFALCAAFKIYLTRNRLINEQNYNLYNNLLTFSKKAFYLKTSLPYQRNRDYRKKIDALRTKVSSTRNIVNSKWLLGQIDALIVSSKQ